MTRLIYAIANGQADTDRIIRIFLEVATEFCKNLTPGSLAMRMRLESCEAHQDSQNLLQICRSW